ncbi:hypothetical protein RKE29_17265 [Streptomyces sp. B1866]|uniref:hypothetical protein n=1 Tax=Streptomyces sp. B1866 TaxID=3075431 RepID=UPI0028929089|nr:hypothetical protein [Streptomyces sp. B1866]MDT3398375.1 hypothetical protein [Streptomyces sp. B1866]
MTDRSLAALGYGDVPALSPLTYPGRPVTAPALLVGGELWDLRAGPGPVGTWRVPDGPDGTPGGPLDAVLARLGQAPVAERLPVLAVGSNASPAQLSHKLTRLELPSALPLVPVRVRGVAVGASAHIGRYGYVAAAPYADPNADTRLVVGWLDPAQLAAVDATETPAYHRLPLASDFPAVLPSGEPLAGAHLYAGARGVLADATGAPRAGGGDQAALLAGLLAASARLRALLGPDPATWVARAGSSVALRDAGTRAFREEGWVLPQEAFRPHTP